MRSLFHVEFGLHVPEDSIASMVTGLGAHGLVKQEERSRTYLVEVLRPSKAAALRTRLKKWESYGFLRWKDVQQ